MFSKKNLLSLTLFCFFLIIAFVYFQWKQKQYDAIQTFEQCVNAGYKLLPTYPETCKVPGKVLTNLAQIKQLAATTTPPILLQEDYKNTRYIIDSKVLVLSDGRGSMTLGDSTTTIPFRYFGDEVSFVSTTTLENGTSTRATSTVFLLTADTEIGSQIFFIALAIPSIKSDNQTGSNALFIGEGISPQTVEHRKNKVIVNYGEKPVGKKPMAMKSKYYEITDNQLVEVPH
jgi:hypothetical protein